MADVAERPAKRLRPLRARQPRLRLKVKLILLLENSELIARFRANATFSSSKLSIFVKVVEGSQEEIQNLPGLPDPEPQVGDIFRNVMNATLCGNIHIMI